MDALLPVINPGLVHSPASTFRDNGFMFFGSIGPVKNSNLIRIPRIMKVKAVAHKQASTASSAPSIDFSDPDWKSKYQQDFEARFNIPHITDVLPDAISYPSTFCLKMR